MVDSSSINPDETDPLEPQRKESATTASDGFSRSWLVGLYRQMSLIRRFEERSVELFKSGVLRGTIHPSIGQEAIAVGACAALKGDDWIASSHRGHGHCIAKGTDVKRMMAELFGKHTGCCSGKGGSMHIADSQVCNLGANGVVGAGIGIAGGSALAFQLEGKGRVALAFFGDGAVNAGIFHETANLASVWRLPLVLICENNSLALSIPTESVTSGSLVDRAAAYSMRATSVDGNDLVEVWQATRAAVEVARQGGGPSFLECRTLRWEGHSVVSRPTYATKDAAQTWKAIDPIPRFADWLQAERYATPEVLAAERAQVEEILDEAQRFAEESAEPPLESAREHVYAPEPSHG